MTSETTSTTRSSKTTAEADGRDTVAVAASQVRGALQGVSQQVPQVARASRGAIDDLYRMIDTSSDERVTAGVTLSLGLAIGMLLGGANRLLIALSLIPVAITGFVMADRRGTGSSRTSRSGSAAS
ncbi:MAG TPA: hypothetical protein VHL56_06650 [Candidatus Limnocylindrales bacterium]|jgi:hypothetical protein|nr:hypothetical protein [Candidatus Limnocylindrales bacterium]